MRKQPPRKVAGKPTGRRRINGNAMDVASFAAFMGQSEKQARGQISRGLVPYHRLGGRIVILADELTDFLRRLPGVTVDQALANVATRAGDHA